jgi:hypothetical protein
MSYFSFSGERKRMIAMSSVLPPPSTSGAVQSSSGLLSAGEAYRQQMQPTTPEMVRQRKEQRFVFAAEFLLIFLRTDSFGGCYRMLVSFFLFSPPPVAQRPPDIPTSLEQYRLMCSFVDDLQAKVSRGPPWDDRLDDQLMSAVEQMTKHEIELKQRGVNDDQLAAARRFVNQFICLLLLFVCSSMSNSCV